MNMPRWAAKYKELRRNSAGFLPDRNVRLLHELYSHCPEEHRKEAGELAERSIYISDILVSEMGLGSSSVTGCMAYPLLRYGAVDADRLRELFGSDAATIADGLDRVSRLYGKTESIDSENYRMLLLSFAQDVRVIFVMIADKLLAMRNLSDFAPAEQDDIARETSYLYAPMAHRMGLYKIKTELEDLSLKHTQPEIYKQIARKLNETKASRDAYIANFISPLKEKLEKAGLKFEIKGRTKSINSIWNKMRKQNTSFEGIYDLFAIRVILDSAPENEKAECWNVYSIVTDMYTPNTKRLRDWLSQPKANGYESLHTTVMGPEGKWVEVQIRTRRMDEIAEKGVAAHWKYKGLKGESSMDEWLKNLRSALENPELHGSEYMKEFKLNLYDEEVFVFTPNGDLHKLPKGATLLDFAYSIHTQIGNTCIGGRIGSRNVNIRYQLQNGDQIEIITSSNQRPRADWINIAVTSKAKQKIRQVIKEYEAKETEAGRELLLRRFKNWKIEFNEALMSKIAKKRGYKNISDMYIDMAAEKINLLEFRDYYLAFEKKEEAPEQSEKQSAEKFENRTQGGSDDTLIISDDAKGVMYSMAKCCNPIFGDEVFGFVSVSGGIKIHRKDCPNAPQLLSKYGYRVVRASWNKEGSAQNLCTLNVVGKDDLSIVSNISSLLSKQKDASLRSITINSDAGLFEGRLVLLVTGAKALDEVIAKIRTIKGIKSVSRV